MLKKDEGDLNEIIILLLDAKDLLIIEREWRSRAENNIFLELIKFDKGIMNTIGLRLQDKLTKKQAKKIAACRSVHRDISLNF